MKKFTALFLSLLMLVPLCLAACDPTTEACVHVISKVEAKTATCTEDGNTEYYRCEKCQTFYTDSTYSTEIINKNSVKLPAAHDYGSDGKCTVCSAVIPEKLDLLNSIMTSQGVSSAEAELDMTMDEQSVRGYMAVSFGNLTDLQSFKGDVILLSEQEIYGEKMQLVMGIFVRNGAIYTTEMSNINLGDDFVSEFRTELAKTKPDGITYIGTFEELMTESGMDFSTMFPEFSLPSDEEIDLEILNTVAAKLYQNLIENIFSEYKKTDAGYELTFDFYAFFERLFDGVIKVAEAIDKDNQTQGAGASQYSGMKVLDILKLPETRQIIEPYFQGLTATQIKAIIEEIYKQRPEDTQITLPEIKNENAYDYILDILCSLNLIPEMTIGELIGGEDGFTGNLNSVNLKNIIENAKTKLFTEMQKELNAMSATLVFDNNKNFTGLSVNIDITNIEYEVDPDTFEETDVEVGRSEISISMKLTFPKNAPTFTNISGYECTIYDISDVELLIRGYENFFYVLDFETYETSNITLPVSAFSVAVYPENEYFEILINDESAIEVEYYDPTEIYCYVGDIYNWDENTMISAKGYDAVVTCAATETADGTLYTFIGRIPLDTEEFPDEEAANFEFKCTFILNETVITIE